jgi:TolB protein
LNDKCELPLCFPFRPDGADQIVPKLPSWSPDGSKVAFVGNKSGQTTLFVADANGSGLRALDNCAGPSLTLVGEAVWSPDGGYLATIGEQAGDSQQSVVLFNLNPGHCRAVPLEETRGVFGRFAWTS